MKIRQSNKAEESWIESIQLLKPESVGAFFIVPVDPPDTDSLEKSQGPAKCD